MRRFSVVLLMAGVITACNRSAPTASEDRTLEITPRTIGLFHNQGLREIGIAVASKKRVDWTTQETFDAFRQALIDYCAARGIAGAVGLVDEYLDRAIDRVGPLGKFWAQRRSHPSPSLGDSLSDLLSTAAQGYLNQIESVMEAYSGSASSTVAAIDAIVSTAGQALSPEEAGYLVMFGVGADSSIVFWEGEAVAAQSGGGNPLWADVFTEFPTAPAHDFKAVRIDPPMAFSFWDVVRRIGTADLLGMSVAFGGCLRFGGCGGFILQVTAIGMLAASAYQAISET